MKTHLVPDECPKCGGQLERVVYVGADEFCASGKRGCPTYVEHLHHVCPCGYFLPGPCNDAAGVTGG
jgi:hypothetical protein